MLLTDLPRLPADFETLRAAQTATEAEALTPLRARLQADSPAPADVAGLAQRLIQHARQQADSLFQSTLSHWPLHSREGQALLTLAEALLRIPDRATAERLLHEELHSGQWQQGQRPGSWPDRAGSGLHQILRRLPSPSAADAALSPWLRLGDTLLLPALQHLLQAMAQQFVLGHDLHSAQRHRRQDVCYSFDCLGEAAQTADEAAQYLQAYRDAIHALAHDKARNPHDSLSIKLSALHPRYEFSQWSRLQQELLPRLCSLLQEAAAAGIAVSLDAEESERLEISLALFAALKQQPGLRHWSGLGLVVQAYQKRADAVLDFIAQQAQACGHAIPLRLVKGAYWDSEIKRAQQLGLADYPVYTRKAHTDIAYLALAQKILKQPQHFRAQFASHNAHTLAWIECRARTLRADYEVQKLQGMGDNVHAAFQQACARPLRIYAPIGDFHRLLPYLVRRLLENGSSQSFLKQLADTQLSTASLLQTQEKLQAAITPHPRLPAPRHCFADRPNSPGWHAADARRLQELQAQWQQPLTVHAQPLLALASHHHGPAQARFNPARPEQGLGQLTPAQTADVAAAYQQAAEEFPHWSLRPVRERAALLRALAAQLQNDEATLLRLLITEAGKTLNDAQAEWREAVDFCHYYAAQAERLQTQALALPAVSGEHNSLSWHGRGVFLCISPWNFPLAIFLGQITAALVSGNTVIAKPASQTPLIAYRAVALAHAAGIPRAALQLLPGSSEELGAALLQDPHLAGVAFTGSTTTATAISRQLAAREGARLPLIAETGGLNALIADSTALPEQLVSDVLNSAFNSAGQRCSALRVLWLQEEACAMVLPRLQGALQEWQTGDPGTYASDMGPLIDAPSKQQLQKASQELALQASWQACGRPAPSTGFFMAPQAFLLARHQLPQTEIFGPVLAITTWRHGELPQILEWIKHSGYGLTLGVHSRLPSTLEFVQKHAAVGNIYCNRNQIGAVVGCQPFGGEAGSGTGFKAGGPHYLLRFMNERCVSRNLSALGINTSLLNLDD